MKKKLAFLLVLALVLLGGVASAVVQPGDDFYYLDTANVLSEEAEGIIFFCNRLLEEKCGAQIVVAALDRIGSEDIYDYAYDMFNEWGVGSAEKNNGLLLLMAIEEDNYYALSGAGVDRILSSSVLQKYLDDDLEPDFAKKDYEEGVMEFFAAVLDCYADYYNLNLDIRDGRKAYENHVKYNSAQENFGGARGGGAALDGPTSVWYGDSAYADEEGGILSVIIWFIVLLVVMSIVFGSRRRGGIFFMPVFRSRPYRHYHHHYHHVHHRPTVHHHSSTRSSGFGSAGRSSFGGGGFGGARGGGGRSFGGGAGRGRH